VSKKTFSAANKEKAVKLMLGGQQTQKQIAEKFGCSVSALQLWKKEIANKAHAAVSDEDAWEEPVPVETETVEPPKPAHVPAPAAGKDADAAHNFIRQFWNKNYRAVDALLTPKDVSSDEAVKLVNEALQYAYNHFQK
jgi:transposase-like protein